MPGIWFCYMENIMNFSTRLSFCVTSCRSTFSETCFDSREALLHSWWHVAMVAFCNLKSSGLFKGVGRVEKSCNIFSLCCDQWSLSNVFKSTVSTAKLKNVIIHFWKLTCSYKCSSVSKFSGTIFKQLAVARSEFFVINHSVATYTHHVVSLRASHGGDECLLQTSIAVCTHWIPGSVTSLCSAGLLAYEPPAPDPFQPELNQPMICFVSPVALKPTIWTDA